MSKFCGKKGEIFRGTSKYPWVVLGIDTKIVRHLLLIIAVCWLVLYSINTRSRSRPGNIPPRVTDTSHPAHIGYHHATVAKDSIRLICWMVPLNPWCLYLKMSSRCRCGSRNKRSIVGIGNVGCIYREVSSRRQVARKTARNKTLLAGWAAGGWFPRRLPGAALLKS